MFGTGGTGVGESDAAVAALEAEEALLGELIGGPLRRTPLALISQVRSHFFHS